MEWTRALTHETLCVRDVCLCLCLCLAVPYCGRPGVEQTLHCLVRGGWAQDDRTGSLLALGVQQKHVPLVTELLQQWAAAQQAGSDTGDGDRHAAAPAAPSAGQYFGATDAATGGTLLHMALDNRRLVLDIAHKVSDCVGYCVT